MSLSNQKQSSNSPVKRYYNWSGSEGNFTYWDREKEERIKVECPFTFIPIDALSCVEGYHSKSEKGFRSNEVRSTGKEDLEVRWNGGTLIIKGLYKDIKDQIEKLGGKYNRSLYAVQEIDGEWSIINIKLKGAAMSSYLNFDKRTSMNLEGLTITVEKSEEKKTGNVKYFEPVFSAKNTDEKTHSIAVTMDSELQEYLKNRGAYSNLPGMTAEEFDVALEEVKAGELTPEEKKQLVSPKKATKSTKEIGEDFDALFDE